MRKIIKLVMSLIDQIKNDKKPNVEYHLSKKDIEYILTMIGDSTFKGRDIETLYTIIYKLQAQYKDAK